LAGDARRIEFLQQRAGNESIQIGAAE